MAVKKRAGKARATRGRKTRKNAEGLVKQESVTQQAVAVKEEEKSPAELEGVVPLYVTSPCRLSTKPSPRGMSPQGLQRLRSAWAWEISQAEDSHTRYDDMDSAWVSARTLHPLQARSYPPSIMVNGIVATYQPLDLLGTKRVCLLQRSWDEFRRSAPESPLPEGNAAGRSHQLRLSGYWLSSDLRFFGLSYGDDFIPPVPRDAPLRIEDREWTQFQQIGRAHV